jgi:serine/threonine protein phosphatase PrpC
MCSYKGLRPTNEDTHTVIVNRNNNSDDINIYGIYDGHGGKFVSNYLKEHMPNYLTNIEFPCKKKTIKDIFRKIHKNLKNKYYSKSAETGSTCLNIIDFIYNKRRYLKIINVGDSRAIIAQDNLAIPLTKDHKPNTPEEKHRIEKAGGKIFMDDHGDWRVSDLSLSRAVGDLNAKHVISEPAINIHRVVKKDKFIVLACDGLWDVMTNQDVVDYIIENCYNIDTNKRLKKNINIAKLLGKKAIDLGSSDNISIIVVFLDY